MFLRPKCSTQACPQSLINEYSKRGQWQNQPSTLQDQQGYKENMETQLTVNIQLPNYSFRFTQQAGWYSVPTKPTC